MQRLIRPKSLAVVVLVALVLCGGIIAAVTAAGATTVVAREGGFTLTRTASGLLTHDTFARPISDRRLQDSFEFNGSGSQRYDYVYDAGHGLKVGQHAQRSSRFKGWFAVTLAAFPVTSVFHVEMSRPPGNVSAHGHASQSVFAVQTASTKITGLINFVEVTSDSLKGSTAWQIDYSHGRIRDARSELFWRSTQSTHAPLSHEITVRTNGRHRLTVWFGDRVVFQSDSVHLNMEAPFQPYLEVQSLRGAYVSSFRNFWVTKNAALTMTGLPVGSRLRLLPPHGGRALASATAKRSGVARLVLPPPEAKGRARLSVSVPGGRHVVLGPFRYAGGDHYRLRTPRPSA